MPPLVSVICLCYNHAPFLREALDSVLAQTYPNLEIIVVDDLSTDDSVAIIQEYVALHPEIKFIQHTQNLGNCASFNQAFFQSKGAYIIDFATDDVLHPDRITQQVKAFKDLPKDYGVVYTDAEYISENSAPAGKFYLRQAKGKLMPEPASGDVFADVLGRYFICPPTMMIRRQVLEELQGYDPELAYEDFDFWVRSARNWKYFFLDQTLCQRRLHANSLSRQVYKPGDRQLASTVKVIEKAIDLVWTEKERQALIQRIKYEARHAYFTQNFPEAAQLLQLLEKQHGLTARYKALAWLTEQKIPLGFVRRWYQRLWYQK
ncbi:glycosyltransferase [Rufibacter sp. LB8]|uniref:glycosyltransferase family 2 protein n=1 Tax=Rufibacter sp. LB8 TaxID=2777781 RepID=UPI00178C48F1|nr:glycosyltransferase [Rufibacter sp. LB8]